ncbi:MAG: adenylyl-sulfate kinase [Candidatus Kapabacteria bacterium]|nr:adenylyl-sulfate kinase [Candidatus Kapabacteria bacterium]
MTNVVWITGLSGAGKSTLAAELVGVLRHEGRCVVLLDGDELREVFSLNIADGGEYSREQRIELALRYSRLCGYLAEQGLIVVIATISMFAEVHSWNRAHLPGYLEVYIKVPTDELRRRDPKGIYQRFDAGEVNNVAGLDLKVDEPLAADLIIDHSESETVQQSVQRILRLLSLGNRDE